MKNFCLSVLVFALVAGCTVARAAGPNAAPAEDMTAPSYDMKPQSILDLDDMHKKFVSLAQAVPADKFTWRPAPGVRSIAEVYLHIANANYGYAKELGTIPAHEYDAKGFEQSTTDKAKIIDEMNKSFAYAHAAIDKMANADFKKPMPKFGPDANEGDIVYLLVTHAHEHLGQSIAYARVNGIVPPWTEEAMKAKADKKSE
jgi:uncharacterized damage-inducible protein DinB